MSVSFKIPSSPSKSIFEIDEFLGVDLTNSGTNIEEKRSPNAPNMVRLVPGKVRKRTGFSDQIRFFDGIDCNLCDVDFEYGFTYSFDDGNVQTLYNFPSYIRNLPKIYIYYEYECDGEVSISVVSESTKHGHTRNGSGTERFSVTLDGTYTHMEVKKPEGSTATYCDVKKLAIFPKISMPQNSMEWIPPFESDIPCVLTEETKPVYGVFSIKTNEIDGNRVTNVNRALETSSEYKTTSCTTIAKTLYDTGENLFEGLLFFLEFDYELSGSSVTLNAFGNQITLEATTTSKHVSFEGYAKNYQYSPAIKVTSASSSALKTKNFSLLYAIDDDYEWSAAPEDNGEEFHEEDIYYTKSSNVAIIDEYSDSSNASSGVLTKTVDIADEDSNIPGFSRVNFTLHTSSYSALTRIDVTIKDSGNATLWTKRFTHHLDSVNFDLFLCCSSATRYVSKIVISYTVGGNTGCWTNIKDISINAVEPRSSYDIASKYYLYHVGKNIFLRANNSDAFTKVYDNANESLSSSWQLGNSLFILDGNNIYSYTVGDEGIIPIGDGNGYIPLVTIQKAPSGGGTPYEPLNMLQPGFYEQFYVGEQEASQIKFFLSFGSLDSKEIKAWVLDENANWVEKKESVDFIVNRGSGYIVFNTPPGISPLTGEDNVRILAFRTIRGYKERVTKCTIGTLFGVNGASDRLFLSGNPDYPNWDFYSEQYDPSYFPDTGYSVLGLSSSAVVGYAIVNNYLATFKDEYEPSQSVFIREGDLITDSETKISTPAFKLINTLQGNGVIAPHSFAYMQTEPLFLTRSGIYAITSQDITGEKYSQNRSFYLNGELTQEPNLEKAVAVMFNDMYILSVNNKFYILDGLQPTRTDKSEPYATRQYVGFLCTDIPAECLWIDNQALWFGTHDGRICMFATDIDEPESYSDNGKAIECCWETPDLDGKLFYKNKSFRYIAIRMMAAAKTSVKLFSMARGVWSFIKEDNKSGKFFDFEYIDFEDFAFSTDRSDKVAFSKIRVKKVDKARFKFENNNVNEPFGLMNLALEYVESGNYKG